MAKAVYVEGALLRSPWSDRPQIYEHASYVIVVHFFRVHFIMYCHLFVLLNFFFLQALENKSKFHEEEVI